MELEDRIAIVTGGAKGIGRSIACLLAQEGAKVVIADIDLERASKTSDEINKKGLHAYPVWVDVSDPESIKKMVEKIVSEYNRVDILVNNAGILHSTPIEDITVDEWDDMMDINLRGAFFASKEVLSGMKERRSGRIINISSLAGRMGGYANGVAYSASKAGLIGLTQAMARRVAEYGITINAVAPGTTEGEMIKKLPDEKIEMLKQTIPMKRFGKPENIAKTVAFLASDAADYITGAVIDINGGIYMG
jgi:3-oxoacyl-[acyl-carrier protein] reductase